MPDRITIPADILAKLEALPSAKTGQQGKVWEPWEDEVLLKYWNVKNKQALAKVVGVCYSSARNRHRQLTEAE